MQALSHRALLASMAEVSRAPWLEHLCVLSVSWKELIMQRSSRLCCFGRLLLHQTPLAPTAA